MEKFPSYEDVEARLVLLIDGALDRETVAKWASGFIGEDAPAGPISKALTELMGADLPTTDRPYLYGPEDFQNWLDELKRSRDDV